jgi:hypothetical protein
VVNLSERSLAFFGERVRPRDAARELAEQPVEAEHVDPSRCVRAQVGLRNRRVAIDGQPTRFSPKIFLPFCRSATRTPLTALEPSSLGIARAQRDEDRVRIPNHDGGMGDDPRVFA